MSMISTLIRKIKITDFFKIIYYINFNNIDHCQVAAGKMLVENSCVNFTSGCPHHHYWSYDSYKCKKVLMINIY